MTRWFRANLEGSYLGVRSADLGPGGRYRLQVYRAALRDLSWIEAPSDAVEAAPGSDAATLWQTQIEHAHVVGVRGPGTFYQGPIFDVRVREVKLTHPIEQSGKSYGRITGTATGWLELPPPPERKPVLVEERVAPAAEGGSDEALSAAIYGSDDAGRSGANAKASEATDGEGARSELLDGEVETPPPSAASGRASSLLLLSVFAVVVAFGLGLFVSWFAAALWVLFLLPTLIARRMFGGVLRDSAFVRGFGYGLIALQLMSVSSLLSAAFTDRCADLAFWPALGVVLLLFPAGLLPSATPLAASALGLALVLATMGGAQDPSCKPHALASGHDRG